MQIIRVAVVLLLFAATFALPSRAQEFSATATARDTTGHVVKSNVYMSGGKVRLDPQDTGSSHEQVFLILDLAKRTSTVFNVGQNTYIQQTPAQSLKSLQFYATGAPPCPPGATCKDDGADVSNGRGSEKWEISQSFQEQSLLTLIWVDAQLHIWTKAEVRSGSNLVLSNELQDIQEGPQPASLFEIPAGYREITLPKRNG